MRKLISTLILLLSSLNLYAVDTIISGVFTRPVSRYFDMDIDANNNEFPLSEHLVNDVIEVVSGMIYGWKFKYVPSDIRREIDEVFILTPVAQIKKGDPKMQFRDNWVKDYIMYQNIAYRLDEFQRKRIKSWNSTLNATSTGSGEGSILKPEGKPESLKEALKNSIKKEFQSRGKDKPRSIEGQILLREVPRVYIDAGHFRTTVEVILIYKDINEYKYH